MKSRQDIPDNQFDEFFKQAAENYRPPFNAGAWRKMNKKLNQVQGVSGFNTGKFLLIFSVIFLLDILIISSERIPQNYDRQDNASHLQALLDENQIDGDQNESTGETNHIKGTSNGENEEEPDNAGLQNGMAKARGNRQVANQHAADHPAPTDERLSGDNLPLTEGEKNKQLNQRASSLTPESLIHQPPQPLESAYSGPSKKIKSFNGSPEDNLHPPEHHPLHGLSIQARVSPDFSSVGFMGETSAGLNGGLFIEYEIISRFHIAAGVVQAKKIYAALEGYQPFPGFWERVEKPEIIEGTCTVTDLSVNLRYDLIDKAGYNIFFRTGMGSWLMKSEAYDYLYGPGADTDDFTYSPDNSYENKHWFGLLNFSAGYEHRLNDNWGIEVNPFVQIPVTEIGAGNVPLQTKGTYFSIKYSFN